MGSYKQLCYWRKDLAFLRDAKWQTMNCMQPFSSTIGISQKVCQNQSIDFHLHSILLDFYLFNLFLLELTCTTHFKPLSTTNLHNSL